MMDLARDITLQQIFQDNAAQKRREKRFLENHERVLEERETEKVREQKERAFIDEVEATTRQIETFMDRLDRYDTAVVEALTDNEHALTDCEKRRKEIEAAAYRLPDGRMAFKTQDGRRVLDERGAELSRDTITPDAIPDGRPRWEQRAVTENEISRLLTERRELHRYQEKLDQARETGHKDGVTAAELDGMGAELDRDMPQAVRAKLGEPSPAADGPQLSATLSAKPAALPFQRLGL